MGLNIKDLKITSPAFESGGRLEQKYAKDGGDVSPPLRWSGVPDGTRELALICHDPDAPLPDGFAHWVVYNIPPSASEVPEGGGGQFTEGRNDFGDIGYGGPLPPEGHGTHHYYFWIYALDQELNAEPGLTRRELLGRMGEHVIEQNRIVGTYSR